MPINSDTKSFVSYLKAQNQNIDFKEFIFQVQSHPDFPSLLSYSDALNFFNIKNYAFKLNSFKPEKLPNSFITLFNDKTPRFTHIQLLKNSKFLKDGKRISEKNICEHWGKIVFIIEKKSVIGNDKKNSINKILLIISILILFILFVISSSPPYVFFMLLSCLGFLLALEIYKQTLGINSLVSDRFCGITLQSDCASIIKSNKIKFLKIINLSDVCVIFFSSQIISLFAMNLMKQNEIFILLNSYGLWFAIPISLFSIYYQWKIEHKWCPLCLMIIAVLNIELLSAHLILPDFPLKYFSPNGLLIFIGINLLVLSLWLFIKPLIENLLKLKSEVISNRKLIRNPNLFLTALNNEKQVPFVSDENAIILGNKDSSLKILFVTSPFCGYCDKAKEIIKVILKNIPNKVAIHLRFNFSPKAEKDSLKLFLHRFFIQIYNEKGEKGILNALDIWHKTKDIEALKEEYRSVDLNIVKADKVLEKQYSWCKKNNLLFTPAFAINNKIFPRSFKREDIPYFIFEMVNE